MWNKIKHDSLLKDFSAPLLYERALWIFKTNIIFSVFQNLFECSTFFFYKASQRKNKFVDYKILVWQHDFLIAGEEFKNKEKSSECEPCKINHKNIPPHPPFSAPSFPPFMQQMLKCLFVQHRTAYLTFNMREVICSSPALQEYCKNRMKQCM